RAQVIKQMTTQLGGQKYQVLPIVINMEVVAEGIDQPIPVRTADPTQFKLPSVIAGTAAGWEAWRTNASYMQAERIFIPRKLADAYPLGARLRLKVVPSSSEDASQALTIEVLVDGVVDEDAVVMQPSLAGMLLQGRSVRLSYDATLDTLLPADLGFRGFRAYAKTIDNVPTITRDLQNEKVEVRTKADAMEQLQRLEAALTRITIIVAAVALLGGSAVLIASFYAAVERKKSDLSLLRLLGFSRGHIFSIPILQSGMLATVGFVLA